VTIAREKSMIRPNIVSRSKIIVEQHFSQTEQRLKVLAKTLQAARERNGVSRLSGSNEGSDAAGWRGVGNEGFMQVEDA
jgi:hypothetical protein